MKMQQEVVEMRKRNEEFKKFALAGAGQFGSDWVWFMRWCFSYPWWFLKSQKQKCLSWSVVSVKRCVYLGGWTWVPFISQWSFPRMFYVHWSFLRACCRSSPSLTVEVTPIFFFFDTHLLRSFPWVLTLFSQVELISSSFYLLILFLCIRKRRN